MYVREKGSSPSNQPTDKKGACDDAYDCDWEPLYPSAPPTVLTRLRRLLTPQVLTLEWVDGARLVNREQIRQYNADPAKLVDTLVQCSLRQMLEVRGFVWIE